MNNRRYFIKKGGLAILGFSLAPHISLSSNKEIKITILHTNDMHSHIHPFKAGKYKGMGGIAERATIIKKIRKVEENILLFDAGDIFQGTPYFNYYGGELEFKLMSEMKYDAATLGNHDFDNGIDGLAKQAKNAKFKLLSANYNFKNTPMKNLTKSFHVFNKGKFDLNTLWLPKTYNRMDKHSIYWSKISKHSIVINHDYKGGGHRNTDIRDIKGF